MMPQLPSGLTSWEEADEGKNFWQVFTSLLKISQHDMNHGQTRLIRLLGAFSLFIGQYMFEHDLFKHGVNYMSQRDSCLPIDTLHNNIKITYKVEHL